jgi:cytochrome d ubiquinol oxidase subunit II
MDLVTVWACIVALAMILYVILDGITLGVALLFPTAREQAERDLLVGTIAPVWDANQTWPVFGGGAIFACFPIVYGVLSSALYIPLVVFLAGLISRGVAFEFRASSRAKGVWDWGFFAGSLVAVLAQGITLGGILTGIKVKDYHFAGGPWDWAHPFSFMVGLALIPGYVLLSSCYLILKTQGALQGRAFLVARRAALCVMGFMVVVTIWTPVHYPVVLDHWFGSPRIYFIWTFPALGVASFLWLLKALGRRRELSPLLGAIGMFLSGYLGLMASFYPYAIPPSVTLWEAAAQRETLEFLFWGAVIVLPVVLGYIAFSYWVFRGKVEEAGYQH